MFTILTCCVPYFEDNYPAGIMSMKIQMNASNLNIKAMQTHNLFVNTN